ncbi:hypothetical protein Ccrd_009099 [Cynara cardunculus var. scolymus]|uniref:Uncharacterized protein n=1 Tax=Cynara cardunculus var. scolymus TaxID=59895 RepID=A0A118K7L8_CYNCS|nr:hypothetical protein Ccrd_009099 [Cynara cardunculus var. scolymus]
MADRQPESVIIGFSWPVRMSLHRLSQLRSRKEIARSKADANTAPRRRTWWRLINPASSWQYMLWLLSSHKMASFGLTKVRRSRSSAMDGISLGSPPDVPELQKTIMEAAFWTHDGKSKYKRPIITPLNSN